jgi:hypothetical protein
MLAAAALLLTACSDNAGPEDVPAERIDVIAAPEGEQFPTDTLDQVIEVRVTDDEGNPSPGRSVTWTASHGGGFLSASEVTDLDGVARAVWVLAVAPGMQTVTASVPATDLSASVSVMAAGWRVASISSAQGESICAIDLAGDTWCWVIGESPQRVESAVRFEALVSGNFHVCGLSIEHEVHCWGNNDHGQLGDGTTTEAPVPVEALLPDVEFTSVVAGYRSTCAVTAAGDAYCWGDNASGQLGRGSVSAFEATPAPVAGETAWRSVSISHGEACGVAAGGSVLCWGRGDNGAPLMLLPTVVEGLPSADTTALSQWAKCALAAATLYCWGSASGLAEPTIQANGIVSISAGYKPIFGLGADGMGYYWGAVPNSSYGWGDPVTAFGGGLPLRAVGGTDSRPFAIERETSTLLHWSGWQFDALRRPIDPAPVRPPTE